MIYIGSGDGGSVLTFPGGIALTFSRKGFRFTQSFLFPGHFIPRLGNFPAQLLTLKFESLESPIGAKATPGGRIKFGAHGREMLLQFLFRGR